MNDLRLVYGGLKSIAYAGFDLKVCFSGRYIEVDIHHAIFETLKLKKPRFFWRRKFIEAIENTKTWGCFDEFTKRGFEVTVESSALGRLINEFRRDEIISDFRNYKLRHGLTDTMQLIDEFLEYTKK